MAATPPEELPAASIGAVATPEESAPVQQQSTPSTPAGVPETSTSALEQQHVYQAQPDLPVPHPASAIASAPSAPPSGSLQISQFSETATVVSQEAPLSADTHAVQSVTHVPEPHVGEKRTAELLTASVSAAAAPAGAPASPSSSPSSDSSSSSSNSSSSESESDSAVRRKEGVEDDLEEEEVYKGPPRTAHEITDLPPDEPLPVLRVPTQDLSALGVVRSEVEGRVVVEASAGARVADEGSLVSNAEGAVLGKIMEVFGPVTKPFYAVRLPNGAAFPAAGTALFAVASHAQFISDWRALAGRGCDASNEWDEEIPEAQQEFSDDEAEAAAKKKPSKAQRTDTYVSYTPLPRPALPPKVKGNNNNNNTSPPHTAAPPPPPQSTPQAHMQPSLPIPRQLPLLPPPGLPPQPGYYPAQAAQAYYHQHQQQQQQQQQLQQQYIQMQYQQQPFQQPMMYLPPQPYGQPPPAVPPFAFAKPPAFDLFSVPPPLPSLPPAHGRGRGRGRGGI